MTTKLISILKNHLPDWKVTRTVSPLLNKKETAYPLSSHSMLSLIFDIDFVVRVIGTTESPYIPRKFAQVAKFTFLSPEYTAHEPRSLQNPPCDNGGWSRPI